jgi:predicted RND superfamily exporter protein
MYQSVRRDGPKATYIALIGVFALVVILFRHFGAISFAVLALGTGILWLSGLIFGFDLKINFLNFIALPITFGIGIDYGVNILQRYRQDPEKRIVFALRRSGGAVALASLTTIIGYSSLLLAGNQAFVSFGRLAVLGEITCLSAALLTLPSTILLLTRGKPKAPTRMPEIGKQQPPERPLRRAS